MNDIYNAKQGLQAVVAKQRHMLPNDVIFRKKRKRNKKRRCWFTWILVEI